MEQEQDDFEEIQYIVEGARKDESGLAEMERFSKEAVQAVQEGVLAAQVQVLIDEMRQLRQDFETKIKYDTSKERQIDSLHQELQTYRAGLHFKILRPLILDLISMHDDIGRLMESTQRAEELMATAQVLKNLASFQTTVEEILQRNGVEAYSLEGETFVSGKQRSLQAVETSEMELDRQIARRVSKGFEYDDRVLRPELVMTYRSISSLA